MKKSCLFFAFCFLLFGTIAYAQNPNCFRITFSDKNDSPYSIDRPYEFLSPRAIAKRMRFNIPVIKQDLPVNPHYIQALSSLIHPPFDVISTSKWNNSVVIFYHGSENYQNYVDEIMNNFNFVESALPVAYLTTSDFSGIPIHKQTSNAIVYLSSCDYDYGNSIEQIRVHNGQYLHQAGFCGEDMLICVFDGGWINFNNISYFQPLYYNGQIWGTRDFASGVNNVYTGSSHGTSTTSIMAGAIEGELVGTAPKANYYFIRSEIPWFEQLVEEDFWAQAAEIADSLGADVINSSLGYTTFDSAYAVWQNIYTPTDNNGTASIASRAASILAQKGVIVVNSAGNSGNSDWLYVGRPADAPNILAVGAVNKDSIVAKFSSYGPSADGRVKPDVASVGWNTWVVGSSGDIWQGNGTSFSGPLIAGLSACLWQALPQYSSLELMQLIRKYGDSYYFPNDRTGYGIPNFYQIYLDHANNAPENKIPRFSAYPNPTTGKLKIISNLLRATNNELQVEIFDITGKKLSSHHLIIPLSNQIDISHLQSGIYFLHITSDIFSEPVKVIKK